MSDPLAALLHAEATNSGWASCVHSPENEWLPWCEVIAARLRAAGVTLAAPAEGRCAMCGLPDRGHDDSHGFQPAAPAEDRWPLGPGWWHPQTCTNQHNDDGNCLDSDGCITGWREEFPTAAPAEGLRDVTPTPKPGDTWEPPQALTQTAAPAEGLRADPFLGLADRMDTDRDRELVRIAVRNATPAAPAEGHKHEWDYDQNEELYCMTCLPAAPALEANHE